MPDPRVVHLVVPLDVVDGWPPVAFELLLAHASGPDVYVLDQTPAFALDLSLGDTVAASPGAFGPDAPGPDSQALDVRPLDTSSTSVVADTATFDRRITPGGHRTFRLIGLGAPVAVDAVIDRLTALGASVTPSGFPELWCVDVPPAVAEPSVRTALEEAASRGVLEFEDPRTPS
jgi:hypothetical protein